MISNEIIKVLDKLCEKFGIVVDWTSQNVMPYMQDLMTRFIKYKMIINSFWLAIGIVLLIVTVIAIYILKKSNEYENNNDDFCLMAIGIGAMFIVSCTIIASNANEIIQNLYMPEITIVEYIQNYI